MPRVLNINTDEIPSAAVFIGRPSEWGNPFKIGKDGTREVVVKLFEDWVEQQDDEFKEKIFRELRGKDLVCFCAPLPCHGDVLLKIANDSSQRR